VERLPNIVLVHGAWADGSSWRSVIERLQDDGFHVCAPQFPLASLVSDVARLQQVLEFQEGDDEAIPPDAQRRFAARMGATTVEVASGHVAMVSHPDEVTDLIEKAAKVFAS
jgi:pimeloyl-ACP methyl ester carboxylesterase